MASTSPSQTYITSQLGQSFSNEQEPKTGSGEILKTLQRKRNLMVWSIVLYLHRFKYLVHLLDRLSLDTATPYIVSVTRSEAGI